jgi:type IV secretory pathway VirB10-like protein
VSFEEMIEAVGMTDGNDPALAAATQQRLRRSLETRERSRHQLAGVVIAVAILSVGTMSWALATGQVASLWAPAPPPPPRKVEVVPPPPKRPPPSHSIVTAPRPTPQPVPEQVPPPEPPAPPPIAPRREPAPAPAPTAVEPVEVLYRRAHQLHFHGGSAEAALAGWDAYLAAEPDGRFSVDARYNRAIALIRLRRYAAAHAALLPFARGEVEPAGYRQTEAEQLVQRLARSQ